MHGLGAFALEAIKQGDFVYEYTGELISQDETERRGQLYGAAAPSYYFDMNEDQVVDGFRKGNKSRYVNHGSANANCEGKVLRVGGEHRISIWAKKDIKIGEELFFNYSYKEASAPAWGRIRPLQTDDQVENEDWI